MEQKTEKKKKGLIGWLGYLVKKLIVIFVPGMVAALIIFVIANSLLAQTSTGEFCGELCHEMDIAYETWKSGSHYKNTVGIEVKCIECHLPPKDEYFTHVFAKAQTGIRDAYHHFKGTPYHVEETSKMVLEHMENETCLHCHNQLLVNPINEIAADIHKNDVLSPPEGVEPAKCIECHADAGHGDPDAKYAMAREKEEKEESEKAKEGDSDKQ